MTAQAPFRSDFVGSFLRPRRLKAARDAYELGRIDATALKAVEDECITELVSKLKALRFPVITDGEFRRRTWHLDFMWACDGISHAPTKTGLPFVGEAALIDDTYLTGRVGLSSVHPFVEHFTFVNTLTDETCVAKQTMPAPAQMYAQFTMAFNAAPTLEHYRSFDELAGDIVDVYQKVLADLYAAGCRTVQFDDCTWGMFSDTHADRFFGCDADGLQKLQQKYLAVNNAAIAAAPEGLVINTHVCRGNYHSTYANSGPYDTVAETLFAAENVGAYYLEFDDERSGSFAPLAHVSDEKKVVLGLITTKRPELEDKASVIRRIHEAAAYVPLERLYLSPQCGFASCDIGNKLTEEEQWAKLALVKEIADEVWG